jgi:AcrR family transcriptional regulator
MNKKLSKTKEKIIKEAIREYSSATTEELSMRHIADRVGISQSVIYHHFGSKDELLREVFDYCRYQLGKEREKLDEKENVQKMFRERIGFQLENTDMIMVILKYYTENPNQFDKQKYGYLPPRSADHIKEVLEKGKDDGVYDYDELNLDAKVIAHSINGFVTEYHGHKIDEDEKSKLVEDIAQFFERALISG